MNGVLVGLAMCITGITETIMVHPESFPVSDRPLIQAYEIGEEQEIEHKAVVIKAEEITTEATTEATTEEEQPRMTYYSNMELTAYIETGNPCADGVYPEVGYTAACNDPTLWHRWIYIEGYGTYYVHDTGGMASNVIDIFVASYDEAIQFGRRSADVYILE